MAMKKGLKKLYDDSEALESRLFSIPIDKYTSSKQMDEAGKIRIKLRDLDKAIKKMGGLGNSYGEFKDGGTVKQMKDGGLMEAIDKVKAAEPTKMREGGQAPKRGRAMPSMRDSGDEMIETMSPFTGVLSKGDQLRNVDGKTMVVKKVPNPNFIGKGMPISDADRAMIRNIIGARKMENGGQAVPKKFKGFSKLPEDVQMQMDPNLAKKFRFGGKVGGKQMCRGMGIARKSGGFKIT